MKNEEAIKNFLTGVGTRIERLRTFRNLSREDLASRAGVTYATIYNAETKGQGTQIDTLYNIASALDVSPGLLLDGGSVSVSTEITL